MKMIHRADHDNNFTMIDNSIIRDSELSDGAKVLLIFMLSMANDWSFSVRGLASLLGLSVSIVSARVSELKRHGYVISSMTKSKSGKFESSSWEVFEVPSSRVPILPNTEISEHGFVGTRKFQNTEKSEYRKSEHNKYQYKEVPNSKKTKVKEDRFVPPTVEQVRDYCEERGNSIDPEHFVDFYSSKGWKVGKNKMTDWKAAVRTWEKRDKPKPIPKEENPFTKLLREGGYE